MAAIKLIVGLGNPGTKYEETRHNAGFFLLDEIARAYSAGFSAEKKFHGEICRCTIDGVDVRLLKPTTFMNLSGQSVQAVASYYRYNASEILVAHDELDLPPGSVRLKRAGGHGGHNGLRDIIKHCGADFWRARLGIGHPGNAKEVINFVLQRAPASEAAALQAAIDDTMQQLDKIVSGQMEKAMQALHTKKTKASDESNQAASEK